MIRAFVLLALPDRRSPCWLKQLCMPANLEARFFVISILFEMIVGRKRSFVGGFLKAQFHYQCRLGAHCVSVNTTF